IPSLDDYPAIIPPYVTSEMKEGWKPYQRNPETNVRYWAIPGTEGFQHRLGGLEKDYSTSTISTDPSNHQKMTIIRQAKIDYIANCIPAQEVEGDADNADLLIVGWGGTYGHLHSAMEMMREQGKKVALAHFKYIKPLPKNTAEILKKYRKIVVAEQNMGQFAAILCARVLGITLCPFNRVKGQPFNVVRLVEEFTKIWEER
ncbi:2-oxoglutarate oxidoreductase subunit KorA, partial [termite gut metagenome]